MVNAKGIFKLAAKGEYGFVGGAGGVFWNSRILLFDKSLNDNK